MCPAPPSSPKSAGSPASNPSRWRVRSVASKTHRFSTFRKIAARCGQGACSGHTALLRARSYPAGALSSPWRLCGRGGTGRRATLRSLWAKARGSSSLLDRTKLLYIKIYCPDGLFSGRLSGTLGRRLQRSTVSRFRSVRESGACLRGRKEWLQLRCASIALRLQMNGGLKERFQSWHRTKQPPQGLLEVGRLSS